MPVPRSRFFTHVVAGLLAALAGPALAAPGGQVATHPTGPPPAQPRPSALTFAQVLVAQGAAHFAIKPFQTAESGSAFYNYDTTNASSADCGLEISQVSQIFFHEDITAGSPGPLTLTILHSMVGNPAGGTAQFQFNGLPSGAVYGVLDDSDGPYNPNPPSGGSTNATWSWSSCCTDGMTLDGMDSAPFCVSVSPLYITGITTWEATGGPDRTAPIRTPFASMVQPVYLCGNCLSLPCPSQVVSPCTPGSSANVVVRAFGYSLCGGESITNDRTSGGVDATDTYPLGTTPVTFTLVDGPGFSTTCTTQVIVQPDAGPPTLQCPAPLSLSCAGTTNVPITDSRVQAWLNSYTATDPCGAVTVTNDAPSSFPAGCNATLTTVTFTATDSLGNSSSCTSDVMVTGACPIPPANVGAALRVRNHGSPTAPQITATLDWTLDFGLPRPGTDHYHVLRGTSPRVLTLVPGTDPFAPLTYSDSTPAGTTLPYVHFYSIRAADPCEDVSAD